MTWFGILPPFSWPWIYPPEFWHVWESLYYFFVALTYGFFIHFALLWLWITHHERTLCIFKGWHFNGHVMVWVGWKWLRVFPPYSCSLISHTTHYFSLFGTFSSLLCHESSYEELSFQLLYLLFCILVRREHTTTHGTTGRQETQRKKEERLLAFFMLTTLYPLFFTHFVFFFFLFLHMICYYYFLPFLP